MSDYRFRMPTPSKKLVAKTECDKCGNVHEKYRDAVLCGIDTDEYPQIMTVRVTNINPRMIRELNEIAYRQRVSLNELCARVLDDYITQCHHEGQCHESPRQDS